MRMDRATPGLRKLIPLLGLALAVPAVAQTADDARWQAQAQRVTITRDDWGIAHVAGRSDADAVFGAIYAQAEDDFARIEANYLTALGRTAEAEGESAIWQDVRQRLYVDPADLQERYRTSPQWLRTLMDAWADGLNYYLSTHAGTRPKVLTRFEPWMALSFTEGSIGGDIEHISLTELKSFYGNMFEPKTALETGAAAQEPRGSNGIAIAANKSATGHALLLINPHTSFYFRSELQMTSNQGLNAYGASTWGQFFIYQGFNPDIGWMHTSSGVDNVDEFAETVERQGSTLLYRYGRQLRPVTMVPITVKYRKPSGDLADFSLVTLRTHHGPIVAARDGKMIAEALMWKPVPALEQSWLRTKTHDLASYLDIAAFQANSSNDTILADRNGDVAYLHPQFVPIRDDKFDYTRPVDGADPATDWKGLHALESLPQAIDPDTGWVKNTNNWPWTAAGRDSPKARDFPRYMDQVGENWRGIHADTLLAGPHRFTPESLTAAAFDSHLPAFALLIPQLVAAYDALPEGDTQKAKLAEPIALLRGWDDRWGYESEATTLAIFWGDTLWPDVGAFAKAERMNVPDYIAKRVSSEAKLAALLKAKERLTRDFGSWRVKWGAVNRFQRLNDSIAPHFDDAKPSLAVPFTSAQWGSLASFGARPYPNTTRYYGSSGNSFVAVVEFGPRLHAWAVTAGGESGDPKSPHFNDQAQRYIDGKLRPVYFYPSDLTGHIERSYHPGG